MAVPIMTAILRALRNGNDDHLRAALARYDRAQAKERAKRGRH